MKNDTNGTIFLQNPNNINDVLTNITKGRVKLSTNYWPRSSAFPVALLSFQ